MSLFDCREEKGIPLDGSSVPSAAATTILASGTNTGIAQLLTATSSATALAASTQLASTSRASSLNSLTQQPYSQKYHTLYRKRITLPVFEYRADFMRLLAENQCIVLVGEVSDIRLHIH